MAQQVFISFDIEAEGPVPLIHHLRMVGFVVIDTNKNILDRKEWSVVRQEGCITDPACMTEFWAHNKELQQFIDKNALSVETCMNQLNAWLKQVYATYKKVTWIARPASYDTQWINGPLNKWCTDKEIVTVPYSVHCISTTKRICDMLDIQVTDSKDQLTHRAVEDAEFQALMYVDMLDKLKAYKK